MQDLLDTAAKQVRIGFNRLVIVPHEQSMSDLSQSIDEQCQQAAAVVSYSDFNVFLINWAKDLENNESVMQCHIEAILLRLTELLSKRFKEVGITPWEIHEWIAANIQLQSLFQTYIEAVRELFADFERSEIQGGTNELVQSIVLYLQAHYREAISYETLQDRFGYHKDYLASLFRKVFGVSPNRFLTQLRIDKAKQFIMEQPDMSLKEIAEKVGYEDQLYFSRVFKNMTGVRPSAYRIEKIQKKNMVRSLNLNEERGCCDCRSVVGYRLCLECLDFCFIDTFW